MLKSEVALKVHRTVEIPGYAKRQIIHAVAPELSKTNNRETLFKIQNKLIYSSEPSK